jgi:hypothetical protein
MSEPTEAEKVALGEAGPLLRFASEHVPNLDPRLSLAIAEAADANQSQRWTPEISQKFWQAFAELCDLIKPVTMESLAATYRNIEPRGGLKLWRRGQKYSLAERTSGRYLVLLSILLIVAIPIQLYVWVTTNLSKQVDQIMASLTTQTGQLAPIFSQLNSVTATKFTDEQQTQAAKLVADSESLSVAARNAKNSSDLLERVYSLGLSGGAAPATATDSNVSRADVTTLQPSSSPSATTFDPTAWSRGYTQAINLVQAVTGEASRAEGTANLISGMLLSFFLPILLGAIGAIAFVIRSISDQIRTFTFSSSSPIRHLMRVMLGALMGVVIGLFSGISAQISLPPLALAFLAGYGVEAVFSMFDGLVERFREPAPNASQSAQPRRSDASAAVP